MIMLEESDKARKNRIASSIVWRISCVTFTLILVTFDLYVMFNTTIAKISDPGGVNVHIGPLFVKYCVPWNVYDGKNDRCMQVLFYQASHTIKSDDVQMAGNIMLAVWVPLLAGVVLTRLTMSRAHCITQTIVSMSYIALYSLVCQATLGNKAYVPGNTFIMILVRGSVCLVSSISIWGVVIYKSMRIKFCPDPDMDPILVGRAFTDDPLPTEKNDDTMTTYTIIDEDDPFEQKFWETKQTQIL